MQQIILVLYNSFAYSSLASNSSNMATCTAQTFSPVCLLPSALSSKKHNFTNLSRAPGLSQKKTSRLVIVAAEPTPQSLEVMRKFSEQYARRSGTYFCVDKGVTAVVIKGLAEHKDTLGAPLCPCRHYDDKVAEAKQGFWNCPCVPMRERKECHCMLFLTEDNDFAGREQTITTQEISETTAGY